MSDPQRALRFELQEDAYALHPTISPSPFDLGVTYEGALLEGSLQIGPAKEVREVQIDEPNGLVLLELTPHWSGTDRAIWRFRPRTDKAIDFLLFVGFWTDLGKASTHFSLEVKAGQPPGGKILFCDSPFGAFSSEWTFRNLNCLTRELQVQVNTAHELPEDISLFDIVVLHHTGLRCLVQSATTSLNRHLEKGRRVIILADCYSVNTIAQANYLTEPHGIRLEDRQYGEVLCDHSHIEAHPITTGVRRLRWFRPSPVTVKGTAKVLVRNPENPNEGFLVCGGPHQNLFAMGCSGAEGCVCEGWPFDNGQLFANLLKKDQRP